MPETLAKFQYLKYNNTKEFDTLRGFKDYKSKYSDADLEEYQTFEKIKKIGLRGEPILRPERIDTKEFSFNEEHINKTDHQRNITREEAESYIDNAVFSLKQWKGQRFVFYYYKGATVIDVRDNKIITSYTKEGFDNKVKEAIKEVKE